MSDAPQLRLSFHGGAGTVTGSRHLLTAGHRRVLIDCGLFQGLKELRLLNWQRPSFEPSSVADVILTHTHIDHSGYLPRLVREGFHGTIHCTRATEDLAPVLLRDAAKLQEEDAAYANRKGFSRHRPALPLFDSHDVRRTLRLFRSSDDGTWLNLGRGIDCRLMDAGHILGSAFVEVRVEQGGRSTTVVFSGDVGQYGAELHTDPAPLPECDVLVIESTYGDRRHDRTPLADQICMPFCRTLERGGTILIPAFAMARVQLVTVLLRELMESGEIPSVPVHIDSPMAVEITRIYRSYAGSDQLDAAMSEEEWKRLFPAEVHFHSSVAQSRQINALPGGRIIISSSGMLSGGRVLHHLRRLLPDEKNLVVLAGYQAPGTRGRALLEGARTLRMHGQDIPVRAEFLEVHGLSSHADQDDLMRWLRSGPSLPRQVFVTHGEPAASSALAERVEQELDLRTHVPSMGDDFDLNAL
jgi:metallo-beta-lactamase family protein